MARKDITLEASILPPPSTTPRWARRCAARIALSTVLLFAPLTSNAGSADVEARLRAGDVPGALDAARADVSARPDDVEAHELLIDVMMTVGLGHQVVPAYEVMVAQDPSSSMAWYLLGRAVLDPERATAAYERSLDLDPAYARSWMGLGSLDRAFERLPEAEVKYRKALGLDATLAEAWSGLTDTLRLAGRLEDALFEAQKAMAAAPADPDAYLLAARLQPEMATTYLGKGVNAAPDEPRLHAALGYARLRQGDYAGAEPSLRRALELNPTSPQLSLDLLIAEDMMDGRLDEVGWQGLDEARIAEAAGDVERALQALDALVSRYAEAALPRLMRGQIRSARGDGGGALEDLERALALRPESVDVQAALGLLHLRGGRFEQAHALLEPAAAQRPQDAALALSAAQSIGGVEGSQAGLEAIAAVAERFPFDPRPTLALATILGQAGEHEAAYRALRQAVERLPDPTLLLALAGAARDLGRDDEAAAVLQQLGELTGEQTFTHAAENLRTGGD